jgi:3-oxoacyl-[acyl-carrier-protein] synthase III
VTKRFDQNGFQLLQGMQICQPPAARIAALGVHLPERVVDNKELAGLVTGPREILALLPSLIMRITGCMTRHYAPPGTSPSDLAVAAIQQLVARSGLPLASIDTLIFSSTDMDTLEPATANIVQEKLRIRLINSFDVTNACNSFLQAMNVANSLIATGAAERVLICSGEIGSYVCNRTVESLADLDIKLGGLTLGDAGAAMVLERSDGRSGLTEINLKNLGEHWELCHVPETTDWRNRPDGSIHGWFYLKMSKLAVVAREMTQAYFEEYKKYRKEVCGEEDFVQTVDHIVPHQISRRFVEWIARGVAPKCLPKLAITAHLYGNTASTAIPLALDMLIQHNRTQLGSGHQALFYGAASGFGIGHLRVVL